MFTSGEWWGMEWRVKVRVQNGGRAPSKAPKPAGKGCAGSLMAEMKQNLHCGCLHC